MIRIAVVDDEENVLKLITKRINAAIDSLGYRNNINMDMYTSGSDFLKINYEQEYDAVFLDLDMPGLNGMQTAKIIRENSSNEIIVIVTNRDDLVFDTFQYDVSAFIRKQFIDREIEQVLKRVYNKAKNRSSEYVLKSEYGEINVIAKDIVYVDVQNHDVYLHKSSGEQIKLYYTMDKLCSILSEENFVRCHSGFLLGIQYINAINKDYVELINKTKIPLSRGRRNDVKMKFQRYMRSI